MIGLLDALGAPSAVIAGHDWGATVAWHAALLRPDRFRAVVALSVPFRPRGVERPTRGPRCATCCTGGRGTRPAAATPSAWCRAAAGFLNGVPAPAALPAWLSEDDVDRYAGEFERTGFRGGLNWYRNLDRNWELLASFAGLRVTVPALYMAGDRDLVVGFPGMDRLLASLPTFVPALQGPLILPGCGHWTQQERPEEVSTALIDFLRRLPFSD